MSILKDLRKNKSALMAKVNEAMKNENSSGDSQKEEGYWQPTRDASGNGSALIRILPAINGDDLPWVKIYSHAFKGPTGKWYIENSLTTLGQEDPVSNANRELWETGTKENQDLVRTRKRKTTYIANILVIKDPANPANDGKVFKWKFGKQIMEKITESAQPTFADQVPVYVYDIDAGANFRVRVKTVDKYPNYDSSLFDSPSPLCGGDEEEMERVLGQCYKLSDLVAPSNFKTYDELKKRLDFVLNGSKPVGTASELLKQDSAPKKEEKAAPWEDEAPSIPEKKTDKAEVRKEEEVPTKASESDDDDDMALFRKMLAD